MDELELSWNPAATDASSFSFWDDVSNWFSGSGGQTAAIVGGGLLGLLGGGGGGGGSQVTGYQGGIPRYTATREVIPVADADRRPGSGGRYYFGDVVYTPMQGSTQETTPAPVTEAPPPAEDTTYENANTLGNQNAAGGLIRLAMGGMPRYAGGGISSLGMYSDGGQMLKGPGTGQSDDIPATIEGEQPARLARDEFVIPADVVSMLGDGSSDAGAERLYAMMDRIRQAAHGKAKQQRVVNPKKVLPA